jgi:alpha-L-rhamnosidase
MAGFNYVLGLEAMSRIAIVLGNHSAAARYAHLANAARDDFHDLFYNTKVERYGGDIMAVQSLTVPALKIGSPPPALIASVVQTLDDDLAHRTNYTLRVGAVTAKLLLNVLSENGLHESALRTATANAMPSWGYWWEQNLTTCAEAFPNNFTFQQGTLNHIFLCGGIGHWMWKHLVGLTPAAPGFAEVTLAPKIHDTLGPKTMGGEFLSPKGMITSRWDTSSRGVVKLTASLPVGVHRATVVVPKPMVRGTAVTAAVVKLEGVVVWDGTKLVGKPSGIEAAVDLPNGVAFTTSNGVFAFESAAAVTSEKSRTITTT